MNATAASTNPVEWKKVSLFLLLAFGLSWGIDLLLYLTAGYGSNASTLLLLQLQMLTPAASAIFLGLFIFKDSRIAWRTNQGNARWFMVFYLIFTLFYTVIGVFSLINPDQGAIFSGIGSSFGVLSLLVLIGLRGLGGKDSFHRAKLLGGKFRQWVIFGLGIFLYFALMTGLNALFGLGKVVNLQEVMGALGGANLSLSPSVFMLIASIQTVLVGPLIGIVYAFGEEYGWRGFLQEQLTRIGKKRGILLLGLIWSVWHYPVIWMGHNYPGYPVLGTLLMTVFTTCLAFILGYAMLKTGSIWLVAFMHGLTNQTVSYFQALVYAPSSPILSFNAGIYGLAGLVLVVLLLLRDPIWRDDSSPEAAETMSVIGEEAGMI